MAKLIYSMLTSLDGYTEDEHGRFGWGAPEDEEVHSYINELANLDDNGAHARTAGIFPGVLRESLSKPCSSGRKSRSKQSAILWASMRSFFLFAGAMAPQHPTFNAAACGCK